MSREKWLANMLTPTPAVGSGSVHGLLCHLLVASHSPMEFASHRVRKMHASCSLRCVEDRAMRCSNLHKLHHLDPTALLH